MSGSESVPDRLYYAASISAQTRTLHSSDDCAGLRQTSSITSCPASHPPRGTACDECFPDRYIDQIAKAARAAL